MVINNIYMNPLPMLAICLTIYAYAGNHFQKKLIFDYVSYLKRDFVPLLMYLFIKLVCKTTKAPQSKD